MSYCKRDHCGAEAAPVSGGSRLCAEHYADKKRRQAAGRAIPKCSVGSCNQQACLASGEDQVCVDHWRATLEHRAQEDERSFLIRRVRDADDVYELRDLVVELVEKVYG